MKRVDLVLLLVPLAAALAGPPDPGSRDFLRQHLDQVESIRPSAERPGTDWQLDAVRRDFGQKERAWTSNLGLESGIRSALLEGAPDSTLQEASAAAKDAERARRMVEGGLTLARVLGLVAVRNPEVSKAREDWRATLREIDQATFLEDLLARYRVFTRELDTRVGPQKHRTPADMTFPFPASLALRGLLVKLRIDMARIRYDQTLRKNLNWAAQVYLHALYNIQAQAILEQSHQLLSEVRTVIESQLEVGKASPADLLKTKTALAILATEIEQMKRERIDHISQANALMNLPVTLSWKDPASPRLAHPAGPVEEFVKAAVEDRQEVLLARKDLEEARTLVRMAESSVLPRGSQGGSLAALSAGAEAGPTRDPDATFPGRVMPDTSRAGFGANAAYIDELRIRVREAGSALELAETVGSQTTVTSYVMAAQAQLKFSTYQDEVVPQARQSFETLQARYFTGTIPFIEFLDAVRTYFDGRLKEAEARRDHGKSLAILEDSIGGSIASLLDVP